MMVAGFNQLLVALFWCKEALDYLACLIVHYVQLNSVLFGLQELELMFVCGKDYLVAEP